MKINKVKNFSSNLIYGTASRIVSLLFPFLIRTIIIKKIGTEYLGISNLFSAILQALNLVELGLGSALVFNMYDPIAKDDKKQLCAYFNFYKNCYKAIGSFILIVGILLIPFLSNFIKGSYPNDINLQLVYFIYLMNTVLSYWLFAYKNSIALAYQRTDIESKALIISQSSMYIIQIILLLCLKNYYLYIIMLPVFTILKNVIVSIKIDKLYPWIKTSGNLDKTQITNIFGKVKALFGHQVAFTVINSADSIILSSILGLNELTIYNNYYYIFSAIVNIFTIFFSSIQAGIGNNLVTDNSENIYMNFKRFRLITIILIQICANCLFTLYNPFMKIWMGTELMFNNVAVIIFCIGFFITQIRRIVTTYKNAAGLWEPDIIKPYIVILVDIIIDFLLVNKIGAVGAMFSTIISMGLIAIPWETIVLFKYVFDRNPMKHFIFMFKELLNFIISIIILNYIMKFLVIDGILGIIIKLFFTLIVSIVIQIIMHFRENEFWWTISRVKMLIKSKS